MGGGERKSTRQVLINIRCREGRYGELALLVVGCCLLLVLYPILVPVNFLFGIIIRALSGWVGAVNEAFIAPAYKGRCWGKGLPPYFSLMTLRISGLRHPYF